MITKLKRTKGIAVAVTALLSTACLNDLLTSGEREEEEPTQLINPMLKTLQIDRFGFAIAALLINAEPPRDTVLHPANSVIALTVTSNRGERESLLIGPYICALDEGCVAIGFRIPLTCHSASPGAFRE